jgi:hypothetical protein
MSEAANKPLVELLDELSHDEQVEVRNLVESLLSRRRARPHHTPKFDWAGALEDMREHWTSVDLQHEIGRLRSEKD